MPNDANAQSRRAERSDADRRSWTEYRLFDAFGLRPEWMSVFVAMGVVKPVGDGCSICEDEDRLVIAAAAVRLGLDRNELQELMALYNDSAPENRTLPYFMRLLARYQRLRAWRSREIARPFEPTNESGPLRRAGDKSNKPHD